METETVTFKLRQEKYAGGYKLGKDINSYFVFKLRTEPSKWHKFWTRVFLGWEWISE